MLLSLYYISKCSQIRLKAHTSIQILWDSSRNRGLADAEMELSQESPRLENGSKLKAPKEEKE